MLDSPTWHVWIGLILAGVGILVAIGLIAYYLATVQSQKYPGGKQRRHEDL